MDKDEKDLVLKAWEKFSNEKPEKILNFPAGYKNNLYMLFLKDGYYILTIYKPNIFTDEEVNLRCQVENILKHNGVNVIPSIKGLDSNFLQTFSLNNKNFQATATKYNELVLVNENKMPTIPIIKEMAIELRKLHEKLRRIETELPYKTLDLDAKLIEMGDPKSIQAIRDSFKYDNFNDDITETKFINDYENEIDNLRKYINKNKQLKKLQPIHGDYQLSNLLVHNGIIHAIFDFDEILLAPIEYELAVSILYLDTEFSQPTEKIIREFLANYYTKDEISSVLIDNIVHMLRYRAIYHIYRWFTYKRFLTQPTQAKHFKCFYDRLNYYQKIDVSNILKVQ